MESSPDDRFAAAAIGRGKALVGAGRLDEAEELYAALLAKYPSFARGHLHLGKIYSRQRRWRQAVAQFRVGLAIEPANLKIKTSLAQALFKDGEYQKAITHCREAISAGAERDSSNWLILGRSLHKMGQDAEAIEALEQAADLAPSNVNVRILLINTLMSTGRRKAAFAQCFKALRRVKSRQDRWKILKKLPVMLYFATISAKSLSWAASSVRAAARALYVTALWATARLYCRNANVPFSTVAAISRDLRRGELARFTVANLLLPVSDAMFINWKKTFFSEIAEDVDCSFFGLCGYRPRNVLLRSILLFASCLKAIGDLGHAHDIYAALSSSRRKRNAAFGHIGLGDIAHLAALWTGQITHLDQRGLTLFPTFGGVTKFYNDELGWPLPESGFERAAGHYRKAARLAPDLPFAWYQLARLSADQKRFREAKRFMAACQRVSTACSASVKRMLDVESSRLGGLCSLAEPDGRPSLTVLEKHRPGRVRIAQLGSEPGAAVDIACDAETVSFAYKLHYKDAETEVVKTAAYPDLRVQRRVSGTVSTMLGAPFISERGFVASGATNFPNFPGGRETFSPMFLGQAGTRELYIEDPKGEFDNAVILPGISQNYFHFLFDALGAALLVDEADLENRELLFFCERIRPFHLDLFQRMGIPENRVHAISVRSHGTAVSLSDAIVPDYPNQEAVIHPEVARRLRKKLLRESFEPRKGKKVYLARSGARSFAERDRLALNQLLARFGFVTVDPGTMAVAEQVRLMRDAETIAVEAGAAASNLLFAPSGASVILISPAAGYYECFTPLCTEFGLDLNVALMPGRVRPKYIHTWCNYEPELDIETVRRAIESAVASGAPPVGALSPTAQGAPRKTIAG